MDRVTRCLSCLMFDHAVSWPPPDNSVPACDFFAPAMTATYMSIAYVAAPNAGPQQRLDVSADTEFVASFRQDRRHRLCKTHESCWITRYWIRFHPRSPFLRAAFSWPTRY